MVLFYCISILSFIILLIYLTLIGKFICGWNRISYFKTNKSNLQTCVTIITPCKDEITNLPYLFRAVSGQTYRNFEFILVDDGSKDGSPEYAEKAAAGFPELKVVKNSGSGKKNAIRTGIYLSENEFVITLDADSVPSSDWLKTIVQFYEENPSDLIICPVKTDPGNKFIHHFQQFEFASLVGSGAGACGAGMPILCNGANLAFKREAWLRSEPELQFEVPSGDDIFLLQSIKNRNEEIRFLKSEKVITVTRPAENLNLFLNQRRRWASKLSAFRDKQLAFTAITVFLASFIIILSLLLSLIDIWFLFLFGVLFFLKWVVDCFFFQTIKSFFKLKNVTANSLIFSVFYPFYIVYAAGKAVIGKNTQW